jgi:hypothetical protein
MEIKTTINLKDKCNEVESVLIEDAALFYHFGADQNQKLQ